MLTNKETDTQTSGHEFNTFMVEVIILLHKCALGVADVKGYLHILHQHKSFDLKLFQLRLHLGHSLTNIHHSLVMAQFLPWQINHITVEAQLSKQTGRVKMV